MNRNWPFHRTRGRALALAGTLVLLFLPPAGSGAPAGKGALVATNAYVTNGVARGSLPDFRLPTREGLQRLEQIPTGGGATGGFQLRRSMPPPLDPIRRVRMQQQVDEFLAQKEREMPPAPAGPQIVERGPHHNRWETYRTLTNAVGRREVRTNSYVELGTGINRAEGGAWVPARALIELAPGGAVATQGAHKASFGLNANRAGFLEVLTPEGRQMRSHVLGLFYHETSSGRSAQITGLKDSHGALHPPNTVVYADAFQDLKADLRYTYKLHGFEQDVILRERPPSPADFGFDPEDTELVVLTEFVTAPDPGRTRRVLQHKTRQGRVVEGLVDETLDFGLMKMGPGKAFQLGEQPERGPGRDTNSIPVGKRWLRKDGRVFLLESVEFPGLRPHLPQLPNRPEARGGHRAGPLDEMLAAFAVPPEPEPVPGRMQMASLPLSGPGLVLDYELLTFTSDFTLRGDTTYCLNSFVYLEGTTTIEGGTVVKFTNTTAEVHDVYLRLGGTINCQTSLYRPAVFTARDDDSVGETIPGSTGTPTGIYADTAIYMPHHPTGDLHDLRIRYAETAIYLYYETNRTFSNLQIDHCTYGVFLYGCDHASFRNVLVRNTVYPFWGSATTFDVAHLTMDQCDRLFFATGDQHGFKLTNGILSSVTNLGTGAYGFFHANYTGVYDSPSLSQANGFTTTNHPFQAVGGGGYYLPTNSAWRNVGSSATDAPTQAAIQSRTTEAPLIVSGWLTGSNTYARRVARDTNAPDLGFHYAPLDYVFAACALTNNAAVTIRAGTSVGVANPYTNGTYHGLFLNPTNGWSTEFQSLGLPTDPNRIVLFNAVQESAYLDWNQDVSGLVVTATNSWVTGECRFTEFIIPGLQSVGSLLAAGTTPVGSFSLRHSSFRGGTLGLGGLNCEVFNCLFDRGSVSGTTAGTNTFYNNTFLGGAVAFNTPPSLGSITVKDNLFVESALSSTNSVTHSHNGYLTNCPRLSPAHSNDVVVASVAFQTGALGDHYLPTNSAFINAGSRSAANAGLYHFTTATNQAKEAGSTVDLGRHHLAVNGSGLPVDTDGDGLPDYYEDENGDGTWGTGESDFQNAYTYFPGLPDGARDFDYDGVADMHEYWAGTDPFDAGDFIYEPRLLGRWRFDTTALTGDQGQVPRHTNNVSLASSWNTNAVLLSGSNTTTRLLNIDYGPSTDTNLYKWGVAAYGLATNDYWYPYYNPWVTDVTVTNLSWSTGTGLSAGHSLRVQNAPGQWGSDTGDYMYNGYVYDWNSQGIANTWKGLPPGRYDLYLYGHGAASDQNTSFSVFTSTRDFGSKATLNTNTWSSTNWTEGVQLVTFTNVSLLTEQALQINALKVASAYTCINGMQLANRVASQLAYREVETNGIPNIYLKRGTAMFWIKPDWTSGTGPGHEGRLLEVGDQGSTNGWWALYCSTNGGELKFAGKSGSNTTNYFTCPIGWSNAWIHVALTYTETNSVLYLNGAQATNGAGVTLVPEVAMRFMSGLNIGGDATGWNNLRGQLDELEIYNYPLPASEILNLYNSDSDGDGVPNAVDADPNNAAITTRISFGIDAPPPGARLR